MKTIAHSEPKGGVGKVTREEVESIKSKASKEFERR